MKQSFKNLTILLVALLASNISKAATYTLTNTTWSPSTPTQSALSSSDSIVIISGTWTLTRTVTVKAIRLSGGTLAQSTFGVTGGVSVKGNATITGTGSLQAVVMTSGTLTLGANKSFTSATFAGGNLSLANYTLTVSGNISVTANATITGSSLDQIDANGNTLALNGGNLTINNAELIVDNVSFSSANDVITSNGGILAFDNSNSHSFTGAAADRHIVGKVRVYLSSNNNSSNTFALGDGTTYAPIAVLPTGKDSAGSNLSAVSGNSGTHYIDMEYFGSKHSNTSADNTLPGSASGAEYWSVTRSSTKPAAKLTFRFSTTNTGTTYSKTRISGTLDTAILRTDIKVATLDKGTNKWTALTTTYTIVSLANYVTIQTQNITPNTSFTIGSNNSRTSFLTPLPVSIIDFSAKATENNIEVKWSTASEKNNANFIVEKSLDGKNWSAIGNIKGAQTSNVVNNYGLVDYKPSMGMQYYRLKQVDLDGTISISKAIAVNFSKAVSINVNLFPNPAKDILNINSDNNASGEISVQIVSSMGEMVYNQTLNAGSNQTIDIASYIPGIYYVTVISEGESKIFRLLKN